MPRVSVIVPVYNTAPYLEHCLRSVLSQSMEDFEIVCVNDGSTDDSASILSRHERADSRVRVIDRENGGLSAARNTGVAAAEGEYLLFLDSDDHLHPDALQTLVDRADELRTDILYYDADAFFDDDEVRETHSSYEEYYLRSAAYEGVWTGAELVSRMLENEDYRPSACLQLIRAGFYRDAGLGFREGLLHEDNLFSFEGAIRAVRAAYLPAALYGRRVRRDSIVTQPRGVETLKGFFVTYLEILRHAVRTRPTGAEKAVCRAVGAEMYRQCINVFCSLDEDGREVAGSLDDSVEAQIAYEALLKHYGQVERARRLSARLEKANARLSKFTGLWPYRLWKAMRERLGS